MWWRGCILLVLLFCGARTARAQKPFEEVRPILMQHCVKCHGGEKIKGEFDLTTREGLLHPGSEGVVVVAGKAGESRLLKLIRHEEEPHMPQKAQKLSDAQIAVITKWIEAGAPYSEPLIAKSKVARGKPTVSEEDRQWWAFRPLGGHGRDARATVDAFVLEKLKEKGLAMNP